MFAWLVLSACVSLEDGSSNPPGEEVADASDQPSLSGDVGNAGATSTPPSTPPPGPGATYHWTAQSGYELVNAELVPDLQGNGETGAIAYLQPTGVGPGIAYLVEAPLQRDLVFPDDALGTLPEQRTLEPFEATGDGVLDLFVVDGANSGILPGPLVGTLTVSDPGFIVVDADFWYSYFRDIDRDGVMDLVEELGGNVEITFGPASRWATSEPDLVLESPMCEGPGDPRITEVRSYPDLTGDGVAELLVWGHVEEMNDYGYSDITQCEPLMMDLPTSSPVDLAQVDDTFRGFLDWFDVISDQTGDGEPDLRVRAYGEAPTVVPSPVTFDSGTITSEAESFELPGTVLPFDLSEDGIADVVVVERASETETEFIARSGGQDGGEELEASWSGAGTEYPVGFALEDGRGIALIVDSGNNEVWVRDLGEASAVSTP